MKRIIYIVLGCLCIALGAVGAVVPLLPAFPFLMLAAFCFARSSQKLSNWFVNTKLYKSNLESFVKGQGMTWATKIRIMVVITILMSIGIVMMHKTLVGQIILAVIWVLHIIMFVFGVKTKKVINEDDNTKGDVDNSGAIDSLSIACKNNADKECENSDIKEEIHQNISGIDKKDNSVDIQENLDKECDQ